MGPNCLQQLSPNGTMGPNELMSVKGVCMLVEAGRRPKLTRMSGACTDRAYVRGARANMAHLAGPEQESGSCPTAHFP